MKILHILNNLGSGGAEKLVNDIAPLIVGKDGCLFEVLLLRRDGSIYIDKLREKGIQVSWLTERSLYSPIILFRLWYFLRKHSFDIVHAHIFPTLYWVALVDRLVSKKYRLMFTEHSSTNGRRGRRLFQLLDRLFYCRFCKIICITNEVKSNLAIHMEAYKDRMVLVHNGVNLHDYDLPLRLKREELIDNFDSSVRFITMVGRFSEAKDQKTLIRAISLLSDSVHLLLVGEGPLQKEHELLANELNLINRVHFLGVRMDVPDILRLSDVGVLSSHWDGFGLAAVESMAAGIPTIASNVDGLSSVIGNAGLLFPQGDFKQLAYCITTLLSDSDYYDTIAKACKERASLFSIEKMVDGYMNIYKEVLQ